MKRQLIAALISSALIGPGLLSATSCGGGPEGPTPLKTVVDDMHLARVSDQSRETALQAKNNYDRARLSYAEAQNHYNDTVTDIKKAKIAKEQADLSVKSARATHKLAKETADMNQIGAAERELVRSSRGVKAAKLKVKALGAKKKWLGKVSRYRDEEQYHQQARYELAKASLIKQANIRPVGFQYNKFKLQADNRSKRSRKAKALADREAGKAKKIIQQWKAMDKASKPASAGPASANPAPAPATLPAASSTAGAPPSPAASGPEPKQPAELAPQAEGSSATPEDSGAK